MLSTLIQDNPSKKIHWICLAFLFFVIVLLAWQADDAYHAHRMSWNLVNGNGFTYNPGERVSATTAPLWTLLTTGGYTIIDMNLGRFDHLIQEYIERNYTGRYE